MAKLKKKPVSKSQATARVAAKKLSLKDAGPTKLRQSQSSRGPLNRAQARPSTRALKSKRVGLKVREDSKKSAAVVKVLKSDKRRKFPEAIASSAKPISEHAAKVSSQRSIGISLSGGKNDKTWVALIEYYPSQKRLFLSHLFERIKTDHEISADLQIVELIDQHREGLEVVGFDVPLSFPLCLVCEVPCPGYEACKLPHIEYLWKEYRRQKIKKPQMRLFTPYTERSVELWMTGEFPDLAPPSPAMGGSVAPLTARAHFIARRLDLPLIEVPVAIAALRLGEELKLPAKRMKLYSHSFQGPSLRSEFVRRLIERNEIFMYKQDTQMLQEYPHAFSAFLTALVGFRWIQNQCESKPKGFPATEGWVAIPK